MSGRTSALMRARYSGRSCENSRIDVPTSTVTPTPTAIMTPMTTSMASHLGSPLRSSQNRDGALMMAMKTDSRKGTTIDSAARIPATITTNAAAVSSTDPTLELPVTSFIPAPQALHPRPAVYPASPGRSRRPARGPAALRLRGRRRGGAERARVRPRRQRPPADSGRRAPMPCGRGLGSAPSARNRDRNRPHPSPASPLANPAVPAALPTVALAQMEVRAGRPDLNVRSMLGFIERAREAGAAIVAFPEMSIPGYILGDAWEVDALVEDYESWSTEIRDASRGIAVVFGNVAIDRSAIGEDGRIRKLNAAWVCHDGRFVERPGLPAPLPHGVHPKTLHPNYRFFDDDRHFHSLRKIAAETDTAVLDWMVPYDIPFAGGRRAARGAALRGHLAPGLSRSPRAPRHAPRLASCGGRSRRQPVRVGRGRGRRTTSATAWCARPWPAHRCRSST